MSAEELYSYTCYIPYTGLIDSMVSVVAIANHRNANLPGSEKGAIRVSARGQVNSAAVAYAWFPLINHEAQVLHIPLQQRRIHVTPPLIMLSAGDHTCVQIAA